MRDIVKLSSFLMLVAGIAGAGLSYVNGLTAPLIEKQILQQKIDGFKEVYPSSDRVEDASGRHLRQGQDPMLKEVNLAYRGAEPAGVIYAVESKGYAGPITFLVGFDLATRKLTAVKVLSQRETPGLGAKAQEKGFQDRYRDKDLALPLEVTKGAAAKVNQIEAITASTITSKAVTSGVNAAREHFLANFPAEAK